jgi:hypothetical protein
LTAKVNKILARRDIAHISVTCGLHWNVCILQEYLL